MKDIAGLHEPNVDKSPFVFSVNSCYTEITMKGLMRVA